jgi:hypothetical protein
MKFSYKIMEYARFRALEGSQPKDIKPKIGGRKLLRSDVY